MTENEIRKYIEELREKARLFSKSGYATAGMEKAFNKSADTIENLLNELEAYWAIGTVEEFKALKLKEHNYDNCHNYTCRKKCEKDGYAKAIDEFADQLKKKYEHCVVNDILMNNDVMSYTNSCSVFESFIDEIAEEMRGAE